MNWTDPQLQTLGRLWMEGKTSSTIASLLGPGVTRNAVIGKVHRLGLCRGDKADVAAAVIGSGASVEDRGDESEPSAVSEQPPVEATDEETSDGARMDADTNERAAPAAPSVTIAKLTDGMCRWPIDDPDSAELRYCGAPAVGATPYCARHSKLAYAPARPVRRPPDRTALFGVVAKTLLD